MTLAQAARVAGVDPRVAPALLPRLAAALDGGSAGASGREWSAGAVIAMAVVRALDPHCVNPDRWAAGARAVGDAHERGLCPAYLVTAGGPTFGVLLDDVGAEHAAARVITELAAGGRAVRALPVAPIVEHLSDVLEIAAPA